MIENKQSFNSKNLRTKLQIEHKEKQKLDKIEAENFEKAKLDLFDKKKEYSKMVHLVHQPKISHKNK